MRQLLTFIEHKQVSDLAKPYPAGNVLPSWYRDMPPSWDANAKPAKREHGTIRRCVPVFDALTAGYIVPTFTDVYVSRRDGESGYEWATLGAMDIHTAAQVQGYPGQKQNHVGKWLLPWGFRTPPGYSCLFIAPLHRPNGIFTCLPGIVDTDSYHAPVNLPFLLDDPEWTGLIPVGTPMIQVIPFRRDDWEHLIAEDEAAVEDTLRTLFARFRNSYRRSFWKRKTYK